MQKCENNGGTTDYYQLDPNWKQAQDIIEARNMNFSQGNILKAAFCFNTPRHRGTDYERELRKIIWFAERELAALEANRKVLEESLDSLDSQNSQTTFKSIFENPVIPKIVRDACNEIVQEHTQNTTKVGDCKSQKPKYHGEFKTGKNGGYVEINDYNIGSQS